MSTPDDAATADRSAMDRSAMDRSAMDRSAMDDEFDTVARWTEEAVADLGPDYAIAAACRGSGQPAALDWLAGQLRFSPGDALLDVGAGVGGPAAYVAGVHGAAPVLVEPMLGACRAARHLFALPVLAGDAHALPVATGAFEVAWSLGVLCTTSTKPALLGELRRVVRPGGRVGLLVFERTDELPFQPEGNHFTTADETGSLLAAAGFEITAATPLASIAAPPDTWTAQVDAVDAAIAHRHAASPRWQRAEEQSALIGTLIGDGLVAGRLIAARLVAGR
jgi:SAM-dependent methyltransferase